MNARLIYLLSLFLFFPTAFSAQRTTAVTTDWPDWRGPARDGTSPETGLPSKWDLAWKAPVGGRSAPIVLGNHLYLQTPAGQGETLQERVVCLDTDSGKLIWEYRFNVYSSDVPPHRVGWASPVADVDTGNVYAFGVGGTLIGLSSEGKLLWERSLVEEFGLITTHGGRTVSPVIDGDLVIVSGLNSGWGELARGGQRFLAFDKRTGETFWVSSPGGRPYDTTYAPPIITEVNGTRLLIEGGGDGAVHALQPQTGNPVWRFEMAKRGINSGVVLKGNTVIVSHSEENLDTSEMGLIAAIDGASKGEIKSDQTRWANKGPLLGFSSPVLDGERVYQVDNSSNLFAFDVTTGKELWTKNLGVIQKASPVLADGKLYVGTESGKFFILKPGAEGCEVLDEKELGSAETHEAIIASPAVSRGRIYIVSEAAVYCIGKKSSAPLKGIERKLPPPSTLPVAHVQVVPTELVIKPGEAVRFRARLFDEKGNFIREGEATWSLEQMKGDLTSDGRFTAAAESLPQAGRVKATIGAVSGAARIRVIPDLPWSENFDSFAETAIPRHWINATGKFVTREVEGNHVLVKLADNPFTKRARVSMGPPSLSDYTVEVDVSAVQRRRQMGDAGVVAQRYSLVLFGNAQKLELQSWQPETKRTVSVPFQWKPDTWYRMKLKAQNQPNGSVLVQGKVWPASEPEPEKWTVERTDALANKQGSPGIYADAPFEVFFDNLRVTPNK